MVIAMNSNLTQQDIEKPEFDDELNPGTRLLHGQYVIEKFLAHGGFGITYLARDSLDRLVVIKECFPEAICRRSNATVRVRSRGQADAFRAIVDLFIEEARNLARLSHPNIVGVHQVFEENDTAYMAIDYVDGRDLLALVESSATINPAALERIVLKLLDAIEFIHNEGILHRDISPDNILLGYDNEPVLIDFGAARSKASEGASYLGNMRTVKDGYSPQEFYGSNSQHLPSSDLYSLAASLYHVMTKERPADAQSRLSAIANGEADPYVSVKKRVTGYSGPFLDAIDQALSVFPKDRMQSAAEWRSLITQSTISRLTRGTLSRPRLAVDNGSVVDQFDGTDRLMSSGGSAHWKGDSKASNARPISVRPPAQSKPLSREQQVKRAITAQSASSTSRAIYLAGGAAVLLAVAGATAFLATGSSEEETDIAVAQTDTDLVAAPDSTSPGVQGANTFDGSVETPAQGQTDAQKPTGFDIEQYPFFVSEPPQNETARAAQSPQAIVSSADPAGSSGASENSLAAPSAEAPSATGTNSTQTTQTSEPVAEVPDMAPVISGKAIAFPVVADPANAAVVMSADSPVAEVLKPGDRLLSVNGFPVVSLADFQRVALATTNYAVGDTVPIALGVLDSTTGDTFVRNVELPAIRNTLLLNGVRFETALEDETWVTRVASGSGDGDDALLVGDRLVALMPSNELIDGPETLADLIQREVRKGTTQFSFAVSRGSEMWVTSMRYAP